MPWESEDDVVTHQKSIHQYDAIKYRQTLYKFNHGYEPQSKLRGIKPSASRDCSTYQFRYATLSELEFQQ